MMFGVPLILIAIVAGFALAASLLALSLVRSKSEVTKRLEELGGVRWESSHSRTAAFDRLFNTKQRGKLQQQLNEAGWYQVTPAKMGARIVAGAMFGLMLGICLAVYFQSTDITFIGGIGLLTFIGAYIPMSQLKSAIKRRKVEIAKSLPDLLDMLASTVQAGQAFNAALASAQQVIEGPLSEEIKAVLSEVRLGRSRADALKSMAARVRQDQLSTTVSAIVQAARLGSNLSSVLEELSEEVRDKRMMRAEEIASLMPTKMVLPMALFMLPALFVVIFGGVYAEYVASPK
ncbi:MAG: type II secretion system F family protein [Candidatus Eremiobacteraeota bacterium]|nr:type II secretion system F family protein [Candidatus Eremiobacteraeota bacterium]